MIYKMLRILGFRSVSEQLRKDPVLRVAVDGDRVVVTCTLGTKLSQRHRSDVAGALSYWGFRICSFSQRQPSVREYERRKRYMGSWGWALPVTTLSMPIVLARAEQHFPKAFDLLVARLKQPKRLNLSQLADLASAARLDSMPPKEAARLAFDLR